jgi:2-polyprenyl-6-methoxyphenol hydroxylase-like FAD-dependent oxidoreductase
VTDRQVPVLVVGGSLVGLSTSLLLASAGVPHLLVERHRGTAVHPRAASFHQRTMEIFRSAGVEAEVEAAAEKEFVQNGAIVSVESLAAENVTFFFRNFNEGVEHLSPTARRFITQIGLEPVLRQAAEDRGAEHLYGTELVGYEQDDDGVTSVIRSREGDTEETVRSNYLVAADGAHSKGRELSGIELAGRGTFADCVTIYFRADMRELIGDRNLSVVYVNHPELLGFFRFSITGDSGFLAVFSTTEADGTRDTHVATDMDTERSVALVRKALGRSDIPVEIDNVQRWGAAASWASRYQDRRVFLAGDAAHVMPPTGGFGGNTGVADAHNLAWKLSMVLQGTAGPRLLDTYDAERRSASSMTVEQAYTRYVLRVDPSLPKDDMAAPLDDASIELGPVYRSEAVLEDAGGDDAPVVDPREPGGRPGTRAPHLVVELDGVPISILDVFGRGFVLLAGPAGQPWCDAARQVAADLDVALVAHRVATDGSLIDGTQSFPEFYGTGDDGAVLVRPDGIVAWRTTAASADPGADLDRTMHQLLFR